MFFCVSKFSSSIPTQLLEKVPSANRFKINLKTIKKSANMLKFNSKIQVGNQLISKDSDKVFIIAEAGVNHGGDMELALKLIDLASEAGANAVKFQTFKAKDLILDNVSKAPYQLKTTPSSQSQYEMLKSLEVSLDQNLKLKQHCKDRGIIFLTTPFEETSLDELDGLDLPAFKVASTDTTNIPFLKKMALKGKPMFLSTGMTYLDELEIVLEELNVINKDIILLQCTANYPIIDSDANLKTIATLDKRFDMILGYSDHSVGVGAAPYAIPMGARVVEKHFTLDKVLKGPDHMASLSPAELIAFVKEVRRVEQFLGVSQKLPTLAETRTRTSLQKCLVATSPIKEGQIISEDMFIAKRTGGVGISPLYYKSVIGCKASKDIGKNEIIEIG